MYSKSMLWSHIQYCLWWYFTKFTESVTSYVYWTVLAFLPVIVYQVSAFYSHDCNSFSVGFCCVMLNTKSVLRNPSGLEWECLQLLKRRVLAPQCFRFKGYLKDASLQIHCELGFINLIAIPHLDLCVSISQPQNKSSCHLCSPVYSLQEETNVLRNAPLCNLSLWLTVKGTH